MPRAPRREAGPGRALGWPEAEGARRGQMEGTSPSPRLAGRSIGTGDPWRLSARPIHSSVPLHKCLGGASECGGGPGRKREGPRSPRVYGHSSRKGCHHAGKLRHTRPEVVFLLGTTGFELVLFWFSLLMHKPWR